MNEPTPVATAEAKPNCAPRPGSVTVIYSITDAAAWGNSGNPLNWQHHGLKAHTVAVYDAMERYQICRDALEQIARPGWAFDEAAKIARQALRESEKLYDTRRA